ncbi:hypothetical protein [Devosia sp. 1566]|uniref:hypothetical protein n=1 Tax=Devosia sp. 1566 TaxID=2499144 RepID=UPI000FDB3A21|nr:hypothetical protein [Devosia sp. 1566]
MTPTRNKHLFALAGMATLAMLQPAMALDAQSFVDRVEAIYEPLGYELSFGEATLEGDTIVAKAVRIGVGATAGEPAPYTVTTDITFSGVTELADGAYMAETVTVPDIDTDFATDPVGHLTLKDVRLEGFYLPAGESISADAVLQLVRAIKTGPMTVTRDGAQVASVASMEAVSTFNPEPGTGPLVDLTSTLAINDIDLDLSTMKDDDPEAAADIEALGLTQVQGDVSQSMSWSMADGHLVVDKFLFDFNDVGALDLRFDLLGVTPALMDKLGKAQAATEAQGYDPESKEAQAAQMMMGMELLQGVTLVGASIAYDDASLADKALDLYSAKQGVERAELVEGLKASLPQMLAGTGVPALADLVTGPVSAFLDDPQSLEIAVQPASPTTLLVLTAAAANPAGLLSMLGLAVTANE